MPRIYYEDTTFEIETTTGHANEFFGSEEEIEAARIKPTLKISLDDKNRVTFEFDPGSIVPARAFNATARYFGEPSEIWSDAWRDMIVGHVDLGDRNKQQLFVMWVRLPEMTPMALPQSRLLLKFFFFHRDLAISAGHGCHEDPDGDYGQANGGGSGNGPNT
jgi:hypothetical protein